MFPGAAEDLAQSGPEPEGTVADGQLRSTGEAPALQIEQQLAPALRALAVAVGEAEHLLAAPFIRKAPAAVD